MMRNQYVDYQNGVKAFLNSERRFYYLAQTPRITRLEKALLLVRKLHKRNKFDTALEILLNLHSTPSDFLAGEKYFLLAQTYAYKLNFEQSAINNLIAIDHYQKIEDKKGLFQCNYNLSVDYSRMDLDEVAQYYLNQAKPFCEEIHQEAVLLRAEACSFAKKGDKESSLSKVKQLQEILHKLSKPDQMISMSVIATVYVSHHELNKAFEILTKLKNLGDFETRPKSFFEYEILKSYLFNSYLIPPPNSIMECEPLYCKWRCLHLISTGQIEKAKVEWNNLCKVDPAYKKVNFAQPRASQNANLFDLYLQKMVNINRTPDIGPKKGKPFIIYKLLAESIHPLSKEEIIEKVWKVPYSTDFDSRFYKLIERLRKEFGLNIITKNMSYLLLSNRVQDPLNHC